MTTRHVLILGGTGDARKLADLLAVRSGLRITLSLAGRTATPLLPAVAIRSGGFGGAEGLACWLREEQVDALVDATHPFAAGISANAIDAARHSGVPLIMLERPEWEQTAGDAWIEVDSIAEAAVALGNAPRTVFLAIGRQELAPFLAASQHRYIVRSVDPVDPASRLPWARYILARGPFDEIEERDLLVRFGVDIVVAKNSGGDATYGKIAAARNLHIPVVMVRRSATFGTARVARIEEIPEALHHALGLPAERGE